MADRTRPQFRRRSTSVSMVFDSIEVSWKPYVSMLASWGAGIVSAIGLHFHYYVLDGNEVGSLADQWWKLFGGSVLAYLASVSLAFSMRIVSVQYMWRALKSHRVTVGAIDAAFSASNDPLAFLNGEIWRKAPGATLFALLAWLIPISTLIAPGTLNVIVDMKDQMQFMDVPTFDINDPNSFQRFSYTLNSTAGFQKFLGPRTILSRVGVAAATTGDLLSLPRPAINSTYDQLFFAPYVQCVNSTSEVRVQLKNMIQQFTASHDPTTDELVALDYFGAIPVLSNSESFGSSIQPANLSNIDGALYSSNQLWMFLSSYEPSLNFTSLTEERFMTCELFNASYATTFAWQNGVQKVTVTDITVLESVPYPIIESTPSAESQVAKSYSAVMSSLASQLTGSVAFYRDLTSSTNRTYSSIGTKLAETVLLGSSDFNSHFLQNHLLGLGYGDTGLQNRNNATDTDAPLTEFSDQRLQDMAYAGARPLDVLISELSKNITISLLTDPLLAPVTKANVTTSRPATIYAYQSRNVVIVYSVAIVVTGIANSFGLYMFHKSGVSHDTSFSSIMCATYGVHFTDLMAHNSLGALPLAKRIKETLLEFYQGGPSGLWGFGVAGHRTATYRQVSEGDVEMV